MARHASRQAVSICYRLHHPHKTNSTITLTAVPSSKDASLSGSDRWGIMVPQRVGNALARTTSQQVGVWWYGRTAWKLRDRLL